MHTAIKSWNTRKISVHRANTRETPVPRGLSALPFSSRVSREILCSCSEALFSPVSLMAILPVPFLYWGWPSERGFLIVPFVLPLPVFSPVPSRQHSCFLSSFIYGLLSPPIPKIVPEKVTTFREVPKGKRTPSSNVFPRMVKKLKTPLFQGNLPNKLRSCSRLSFPCPIPHTPHR